MVALDGGVCECGLAYVRGNPADERSHASWHAEYLCGPNLPVLSTLSEYGQLGGFRVYRVDAAVPLQTRKLIARVAMVAHRAMSDFPAGYDGTLDDESPVLHVVAHRSRAIGMALMTTTNRCWHLGWNAESTPTLQDDVASTVSRSKVARIWVARRYRRHGLASSLLALMSLHLHEELGEFGWELPLTGAGRALVRSLVPGSWWGDGDVFALEETLEGA